MGLEKDRKTLLYPTKEKLGLSSGDLVIQVLTKNGTSSAVAPLEAGKWGAAGIVEGHSAMYLPPATTVSVDVEYDTLLLKHLPKTPGHEHGVLLVMSGGNITRDKVHGTASFFMVGEQTKEFIGNRFFVREINGVVLRGRFL